MEALESSALFPPKAQRLVFVLALFAAPPVSAQTEVPSRPLGVVISLGKTDRGALRSILRRTEGAHWRIPSFQTDPERSPGDPGQSVDALKNIYISGDFLRCLGELQKPELRVDRFLADKEPKLAAQVAAIATACAFGAGDQDSARRALEQMEVAELSRRPLADTTVEVQALAERVAASFRRKARIQVTVRSRPPGAELWVDGRRVACTDACRLALWPGRHILRLERLGSTPRQAELRVHKPKDTTISLDPAPARLLKTHLVEVLRAGRPVDRKAVAQAASHALGAPIVLFSWQTDQNAQAALYDRRLGKFVARAQGAPKNRMALVETVIEEWKGLTEPTPLYEEPLFWGGLLTAAALAAGTVWLVTRSPEKSFALEVP